MGNLLRSRLLKHPHVLFAGYKVGLSDYSTPSVSSKSIINSLSLSLSLSLSQVPHPLVSKFILRVQTDGEVTPKDAIIAVCHDLVKDLGIFSREFTKEFELRKMVGSTQQQQNGTSDGV